MTYTSPDVSIPGFTIYPGGVCYLGLSYGVRNREWPDAPVAVRRYLLNEGVIVAAGPAPTFPQSGRSLLVIEPHPDDLALSAAGILLACFARADHISALTIFGAFSLATFPWKGTRIEKAAYERLRMDESDTCFKLYLRGVRHRCLGMSSALLRGYASPFLPLRVQDKEAIDRIVDAVSAEAHDCDAVVIPAAIGCHVDHGAVFEGAMRALAGRSRPAVLLYEDMPYAHDRKALASRMDSLRRNLRIEPVLLDVGMHLERMADMATIYRSQFDDVNREQRLALLREDCRAVASEEGTAYEFCQRYWRVLQ